MDEDDVRAWRQFCCGDTSGLERIYERHKDSMYSYCFYVSGNRQLSEDIVQETFVKLMEQKSGERIRTSLKGWLFTCTRNLLYNQLKRLKMQRRKLAESVVADAQLGVEQRWLVEKVLARLAPAERELIILREQQRFPVKDIAAMLSVSEAAVRVRLYRVRKKMQQIARRGL